MTGDEMIGAYLDSCRGRNLAAKTVETYAWALGKLPGEWTTFALERQLGRLALGGESRWDAFRAWRTFFRWTEQRCALAPNPMAPLVAPRRPPRLPVYLSWSQTLRLIASTTSRRDRALLLLLLDTGLRLGEVTGIQPDDVHEDAIRVSGKTGTRLVPVSTVVRRQLMGLLPWGLLARGVAEAVRRCLRRSGVGAGGPHVLRHTFAVHYVKRGGDVFSLQRILGHKNIETTRIYVELALGDVQEQHAKFSPALALLG